MIDIKALATPIEGENPAGENLRYTPVYDEIQEARRADDQLSQGDWQHDLKQSDWSKVVSLSIDTLTNKTKDLQIAVWLTEGLIRTSGYSGLAAGLKIITIFLSDFWEHLYPEIDDGDLDFRAGPLEFLNDKIWLAIKEIPITDKNIATGYSWVKWQESRQVGYESDIRNQYGDVDENKKKARNELITEGKLTPEDFDGAVHKSSKAFYKTLSGTIAECNELFNKLDEIVDKKFGKDAPRLAELKKALEDCEQVVSKILKGKKDLEPEIDLEERPETAESTDVAQKDAATYLDADTSVLAGKIFTKSGGEIPASRYSESNIQEEAMWQKALELLKTSGINKALGILLDASCSAPSARGRDRYLLLTAKICLKAERPDLARPIVEKLNTTIEELQLERWESPIWIAEVLDALYQCLTAGEPADDNIVRANVLFQKLCTTDITKAISYKR